MIITVITRLVSTVLAVLLTGTVLCGQCVFCPAFQKATTSEDHGCCKPSSSEHCGTSPASKQSRCHNHRFDENYNKVELNLSQLFQPAVTTVSDADELITGRPVLYHIRRESTKPLHSPPELYLLNSILLV
jgi:hypothetical protein